LPGDKELFKPSNKAGSFSIKKIAKFWVRNFWGMTQLGQVKAFLDDITGA